MAANKAQFIDILSAKAGISIAEATAATNALPESLGEWIRVNGSVGSGLYSGTIDDGLKLDMTRSATPTPHWSVKATFTPSGLDDFGDGANRFGLVVENA